MSQLRRYHSCPDHDPSRIFGRWGLLRCELLDRSAFDAALNSLSGDFDPPADPQLAPDYLLGEGLTCTRLLNDAVVIASESEATHRHNSAWPAGISGRLEILLREFNAHDAREEIAYRTAPQGRLPASDVERLRRDHDAIRLMLSALRKLTGDYRPPADACTAWRVLYSICLKVDWLLSERMDLEENNLFGALFHEQGQARRA